MSRSVFESRVFVLLLVVVSIAFCWILMPFYGAVFWAVILGIIFAPLHRTFLRWTGNKPNAAALLSLLTCIVLALLPMALILTSLIQEAALLYQRIRGGQMDVGAYFAMIRDAMPSSMRAFFERVGLGDLSSIKDKLSAGALAASQYVANSAVNIGQNTFQFVVSLGIMLYLLFFMFRDGHALARLIVRSVPLENSRKQQLFDKFTTVVKATVKGNVIVAVTQGALGGIIFYAFSIEGALLWGVLMAFLSLLPAVGAGLVWLPVALYFLAVGMVWQGVVLILYGVFVIGLVDNLLRPLLVGKDTKMPDYVVLISTIGGMALFGLNGFVIGPLIAALFMAAWAIFVNEEGDGTALSDDDGVLLPPPESVPTTTVVKVAAEGAAVAKGAVRE